MRSAVGGVGRFVAAMGIVLATVGASACVQKGNVNEKQAFAGSLSSYRSASVDVEVPTSITNSAKVKSGFTDSIVSRLREKQLFADVPMSGGDLTVRVTVTHVDEGNKAMQAMNAGGDSEVDATVELYDTKESKVVASFDVMGNSKQNVSVQVGGVDTRALGDTTATACAAAADQIADYLDKHRGSAASSTASKSGDDDAKLNATFTASGQSDPNPSAAASTATPAPQTTMTSDTPPAPAPASPPAPASASTCPLVCMVANHGRAAQADEQRMAGELSGVLSALRMCGNGQNSLTMRFDSSAALTGFGVDAERGNEGSCVDAIRQQRPAVTYQGPATLRCAERCGGDTTTTRPRRRAR